MKVMDEALGETTNNAILLATRGVETLISGIR